MGLHDEFFVNQGEAGTTLKIFLSYYIKKSMKRFVQKEAITP